MKLNKDIKTFIIISFLLHLLFILINYGGNSGYSKVGPFMEIDLINVGKSLSTGKIKVEGNIKNISSDRKNFFSYARSLLQSDYPYLSRSS